MRYWIFLYSHKFHETIQEKSPLMDSELGQLYFLMRFLMVPQSGVLFEQSLDGRRRAGSVKLLR